MTFVIKTPVVTPGVGQLAVSWELPSGSPAYSGQVQYKPHSSGTWIIAGDGWKSLTIKGLSAVPTDVRVYLYGIGISPVVPSVSPLAPPPPPPVSRVVIGMNNGLGWGGSQAPALRAAHLTRIRANYEQGSETPANLSANGMTPSVALIGNTDDATLLSKLDQDAWLTTALAQADSAVAVCGAAFPLEVGNEMYLKGGQADPATYARMFHSLRQARPSANLLFSCTGDYSRADGTWSQLAAGGGWLGDAKVAVPEIVSDVSGFTHHPYGKMKPAPENLDGGGGPGGLDYCHRFSVSLGYNAAACASWHLTEYGSSFPTASDGDSQAADCQAAYDYFLGLGFVKGIYWFMAHDYDGMNPPSSGAFNDDFTSRPVVAVLQSYAIKSGQ